MRLLKKTGWFCCLLTPAVAGRASAACAAADLPQNRSCEVGTPHFATIDWTVAEIFAGPGRGAAGHGDVESYRAWVGSRRCRRRWWISACGCKPNRELLAGSKPDLILISPLMASP